MRKTRVARIRRNHRQANRLVQVVRLILLVHSQADPIEAQPDLIHQSRRKDMRIAQHEILCAAWNAIAETRHGRRRVSRAEWFEIVKVAEAVVDRQLRGSAELMVQAHVELIVAVGLHR